MTNVFAHWFAGFFDGEGHLGIHVNNARYAEARGLSPGFRCVAVLTLRADDEPILHEIVSELGIGQVVRSKRTPVKANHQLETKWWVTSKGGCGHLVELFDEYPLRSKKARDFAIWRQAVLLWADPPKHRPPERGMPSTNQGKLRRDWEPFRALAEALKAVRAYEDPAPLA